MRQRKRVLAMDPNPTQAAPAGRQDKAVQALMENRDHAGFAFALRQVEMLRRWGVEVDHNLVLKVLNEGARSAKARAEYERKVNPSGGETLVYFIKFGSRIKIGITRNLRSRLEVIPHDEVLATVPGGFDLEHRLHKKFAHLRTGSGREWFRATPELLMFIAGLQRPGADISDGRLER